MPRWTYKLTLNNKTDRALKLISSSQPWGKKASAFPERIEAGQSGIFDVYAKAGTATGIECYFTMQDETKPGEASYGSINFTLDMPYWHHWNKSSLDLTGVLKENGFVKIPDGNHDFATSADIYAGFQHHKMLDDVKAFCDFYEWNLVKGLTVYDMDEVDASEFIPEQNILSGRKIVGRTEAISVPKKLWGQIIDQDYKDDYAKRNFVKDYFTEAVYEIRRNLTMSIAANQSYEKQIEISNTSTVRRETSTQFQIENTISTEGDVKGVSLSNELRMSYEINELNEYCSENEKRETETFNYDAVDYDRAVVLWDVVKVLALYRTNIKGETELVGVGDYLVLEEQKTYAQNEQADSDDIEYANCQSNFLSEEYFGNALTKINGTVVINDDKYKWMETGTGGLTRGILFNPGNYNYKITPNPHDDPWYNKNQQKFYTKLVKAVEKKATSEWSWPSSIRDLEVNGEKYTLSRE